MRQLASIQILRGLAALAVVFGHAQHDAAVTALKTGGAFQRSHLLPWGAGVDLFFVISGFIMVYASQDLYGRRHGARDFLTRRLIRIAPLYWMFATLYLLMQIAAMMTGGKPLLALPDVIASYLFFPTDAFGDGVPRPFYTLGWTLNYEMFFYLVFAALLALPRAAAALGVVSLLGVGVVAGAIVTPQTVALAFWTQPIVLEFGLGALVALALLEGLRLPRRTALALVAAGAALLTADFMNSHAQSLDWTTPNGLARLMAWGLPAAMIVAGCVLGRFAPGKLPLVARAKSLGAQVGDASYALYLTHPFVIVLVRKAAVATGALSAAGPWTVIAVTLGASVAIAVVVHHNLEKPMIRWLRARLERTSPPRAALLALRASA